MLRREPALRRTRASGVQSGPLCPHGTRPINISIHIRLYIQQPTPQEHGLAHSPSGETHRAPGLAHPDPAEPAITAWRPGRVPPPGIALQAGHLNVPKEHSVDRVPWAMVPTRTERRTKNRPLWASHICSPYGLGLKRLDSVRPGTERLSTSTKAAPPRGGPRGITARPNKVRRSFTITLSHLMNVFYLRPGRDLPRYL